MAQQMTEAQMMVQSVQQAAQAAAEAAKALREIGVPQRQSGFAEANKTVQCPREFGSVVSSEDQNGWADFSFSFRQWLCFADSNYTSDLAHVEEHCDTVVTFKETPEGNDTKARSCKLYAILAGILRNRPLRLLRQIPSNNGLETWRQLHNLFTPKTKARSMALLSAIMSFPAFKTDRTLLEQVQTLERLGDEYQKTSGSNIADDILLTTLIRALPRAVQQHIQLGMTNSTTYQEVKDKVVAYERVSSTWTREKILVECGATPLGAVTSYSSPGDSGVSPMEVNLVQKGKGKKGKGADKGKGKSKSFGNGKGKGQKGQDSGKGKYSSKGQYKGQSKGNGSNNSQQQKKLDVNTCAYCGKSGHWQKDCLKKKADQNQVRVVGEASDTAYSTSAASVSTGSGSQAVRILTGHPMSCQVSHFEDLTVHSNPTSPCSSVHVLRVLSECTCHDMTATDDDGRWTLSPSGAHHVRAVNAVETFETHVTECDIILDSGADTSALPLKFSCIGDEGPRPDVSYVDAQGATLDVKSTRLANVQFGDVIFKEKFIVSDITCPLLSLGNVLRAGWNIVHIDGNPHLVKDDMKIEVLFKNNSLCAHGRISLLTQQDEAPQVHVVRAVQLGMPLRTLAAGWNRISPHLFAIKTTRPKHVDTTLCPSDEMMWLRTTLVYRDGIGWEVDEYCESVSELQSNLEEDFVYPEQVVEVITLAHKHAMQDEFLGFFFNDRPSDGQGDAKDDDVVSNSYSAGTVAEDPVFEETPVDAAEGEALDEDRIVQYTDDAETVVVDGVSMTLNCTLKTLRAGCASLGLSGRGSKVKCIKRMVEHVKAQTLLAAHGAEVKLKNETERVPMMQSRPEEPTSQETENHMLTHEPYKAWCPLCVQYRAKQDPHPPRPHESSGHSVISFDFGYCSRMADESDKLTCLFIHDRSTKMMSAIPTVQKGGKSLQYLTTEVMRFILQTQHAEFAIRTDREPSVLALAESVRKACRNMSLKVHDEGAPVGDHQANGAAEVTVQQLRAKAGLLIQQVEDKVAGGKVIFGCLHPLYSWAIIHAGWLHNRFVVNGGQTAYERASDRSYTGKIAMFAEDVLGYLRVDKGGPRWQPGIWLGKVPSGDSHVVGTKDGVFLTRSIRRNAIPFNLDRCGDVETYPWEYRLVALGNKLVHNKRVSQPIALGIGPALPPQLDLEALHVENYARAHPHEDLEDPKDAAEAGQPSQPDMPPSSGGVAASSMDDALGPDAHGQKRQEEDAEQEASPKRAKFADSAFSLLESTFLLDDTEAQHVPKTPKLSDDSSKKQVSQVTSTDLSLYEHEDNPVAFSFQQDDLDELEKYDMNFDDEDYYAGVEADDDAALQELTFPFSAHEPCLSETELLRLDTIADALELKRLSKMEVLTDASSIPTDAKVLSTRFVRTWREKLGKDNKPIWLRRSRFVAREFAWMESERDSLFSPASSSIAARVLPAMYLDMKQHSNSIMLSIDVKDAFLTVKQQRPTIVNCQLADGQTLSYGLGKVLPGQRDGSLLWHQDLTNLLKQQLGMFTHAPYPCVLKTADNACYVLIHVDDILVVGQRDYVLNKFVPCLENKYEISTQVIAKPGDELHFLKRRMTLLSDSRLLIQTHHKHVQQMCDVLGLNKALQRKKSPGHAEMDQCDFSGEISPQDAKAFRTCVGVLLYLAADLPHCQHVVRHLATYSTQPTVRSMLVLKHLVGYLAAHEDVCISLKFKGRSDGIFHQYDLPPGESTMEVYTDSDWASDKDKRRSVSCVVIFWSGMMLYSASRTQKLVSLSSAEAELYACSSGVSDSVLLSRLIAWMTDCKVTTYLYTDSSGARGMIQRQGVGRVRHLSCRVLWLQDLVAAGQIKLSSIAGSLNPADIGTKRLPCNRLRTLMHTLGMYNTTAKELEGTADSSNFFNKKQHVLALLSVLGLGQLKGCDEFEPTAPPAAVVVFTVLIGFLFMMFCMTLQNVPQHEALQEEPEPEVATYDSVGEPVLNEEVDEEATEEATALTSSIPDDAEHQLAFAIPRSSSDMPTPEGFLNWLIIRCHRRLENPNLEIRKRNQYLERIAILRSLQSALTNPLFRASAMRNMAEMADISEDEDSPNFRGNRPTSLGDAQLAHNFFMMLRGQTARGRHASMVADALIRNESFGEESEEERESDAEMETASEARRRYYQSTQDEVSDPDLWASLHYGEFTDEEDP